MGASGQMRKRHPLPVPTTAQLLQVSSVFDASAQLLPRPHSVAKHLMSTCKPGHADFKHSKPCKVTAECGTRRSVLQAF